MRLKLALVLILLIQSTIALAQQLSLEQYQKQIVQMNMSFRAVELQTQAFESLAEATSVDFMPTLTGGITYTDDRRPQIAPQFYGYETITENANLGVQTKLRTGTLVNLSYLYGYSLVYGSLFAPAIGYYTSSPVLTFTQPLWKDFNAALSKANEDAAQSDFRARSLLQRYSNQQILFNSVTAYWRLSYMRQLIKFDQDAIDRTSKILKWSHKRVSMNVADRADELQSMASVQQRQLQFQTDREFLREAASQFNSLRNVKGDVVTEEILPLDPEVESEIIKQIAKSAIRLDAQATVQSALTQKALAKASKEQVKPDISIFGTVQFNGHGFTAGSALGTSWNSDNPIYSAGLKLSVPLDRGLVNQINQGYNAAALAADLTAQRAHYDLDQDWNDLQKRLKDAIERLALARELEKLQREKLLHERERFTSGRTTNFQILQFEDNFSDAQTAKLRVQNEIITDYAQAQLYNGGSL